MVSSNVTIPVDHSALSSRLTYKVDAEPSRPPEQKGATKPSRGLDLTFAFKELRVQTGATAESYLVCPTTLLMNETHTPGQSDIDEGILGSCNQHAPKH